MGHEEHNDSPRLLTVAEVADRLNISVRSVFGHIAEGDLPRVKFGHRTVRILESDVDAFINDLRGPGQKGGEPMIKILAPSLDELAIQQAFARQSLHSIRACVFLALNALRDAGIHATLGRYEPGGSAPRLTLGDGTTLTFRQFAKTWTTVFAFLAPRSLHEAPAATYALAQRALDTACRACHDSTDHLAPTNHTIRSIAFCVDFCGWKPSDRTYDRTYDRLRNQTGVRLVPWGRDAQGRYTNFSCMNIFRLYNKSAEIVDKPRKQYISALHRRAGWREDDGDVWRAEATFKRERLKGLCERNGGTFPPLDDLWQGALDRFTLLRQPRNGCRLPKAQWHEHKLWEAFRAVTGWEPWRERPEPPSPPPNTIISERDKRIASAAGQLVGAAMLDGRQGQDPLEAFCDLLERYYSRYPHREAEHRHRMADDDEGEGGAPALVPCNDPLRPRSGSVASADEVARVFAALAGERLADVRLN